MQTCSLGFEDCRSECKHELMRHHRGRPRERAIYVCGKLGLSVSRGKRTCVATGVRTQAARTQQGFEGVLSFVSGFVLGCEASPSGRSISSCAHMGTKQYKDHVSEISLTGKAEGGRDHPCSRSLTIVTGRLHQ